MFFIQIKLVLIHTSFICNECGVSSDYSRNTVSYLMNNEVVTQEFTTAVCYLVT